MFLYFILEQVNHVGPISVSFQLHRVGHRDVHHVGFAQVLPL